MTRSPKNVVPSTKGSKPVAEVLNSLPIRDEQHKPSGVYGRRMTDFQSRAPYLQTIVLFAVAILVAAGLWSGLLQKLAITWNTRAISFPTVNDTLSIPPGLHPMP
jgi:hypothetical protein